MADEIDTLTTQILLNDSQAIKNLAEFATSLTTAQDKIAGLQKVVDALAEKMGGDFDAAKQKVKDFNDVIAAMPGISSGLKGFDASTFNQITASAQKMGEAFQQDAVSIGAFTTDIEKTKSFLADLDQFDKDLAADSPYQKMSADIKAWLGTLDEADSKEKEVNNTTQQVVQAQNNVGSVGVSVWQRIKDAMSQLSGEGINFTKVLGQISQAFSVAFGIGIYQLVSNIVNQFKEAVSLGFQLSQSLYQLNAGINMMRESGIDITMKDVQASIAQMAKDMPFISVPDWTKLAAQVTYIAGQLGLTKDQVEGLMRATAIVAQDMGTDTLSALQKIMGALDSDTAAYQRQLLLGTSYAISAQQIYAEAVKEGTAGLATSYQQLDQNVKTQAFMVLLQDEYNKRVLAGGDYTKTQAGQVKNLGAEWTNVKTTLGEEIDPYLGKMADELKIILPLVIDLGKAFLAVFELALTPAAALFGYVEASIAYIMNAIKSKDFNIGEGIKAGLAGAQEAVQELMNTINQTLAGPQTNTGNELSLGTPASPSKVTDLTGVAGASGMISTPQQESSVTLAEQAEKEIVSIQDEEAAKLAQIQTNLSNKLIDIQTKYNEASEALALDKANKLQDIETKYARDLAALYVDEANKEQSIQANTAESIATANSKYQLSNLEAEQKYQEDLQNLRDQFSLNLEEALRERDAKTIIRLIEQYDEQKTEKAKQYADESITRQENYQQEIVDLKAQEAYQLQELQIETQQRAQALAVQRDQEIQDLNTDIARRQQALAVERDNEIAAANQQAQREADAERTDINNRLKAWADGLMTQYNLTNEQVQNIYALLKTYFGPNGYVDQIYGYLIARMGQVAAEAMAVAQAYGNIGFGVPANNVAVTGMASGGSLFANKPTSVTFGEAGPELAMFIPLGSRFGGAPSVGAGGINGGSIQLQVTLDQNLQAQIVQTSLDNVALSIDRINRQS